MIDLIKKLCSLDGISGRENEVREYIISRISPYCDYRVDNLGNIIAFRKGKQPAKHRLMIDAHMDEVGLIATYIDSDGFVHFAKVGGIDSRVIIGKNVNIGKNKVPGVIGIVPVHLVDDGKLLDIPDDDNLCIDIGATDEEEAKKLVNIGDSISFDSDFFEFGDGFIKSKALDDRVGCAIMIKLIEETPEFDTWFVFSVQEEIGLRGAGAGAFSVAPEFAVALETTTASDISGVKGEKRVCSLGGGAVISFMDRHTIYPRDLFDIAFELADNKGIRVQTKTMVAGGNNAGAIHKSGEGVRTLAVSVPCRYLHSPSCVIKTEDIYETYKLCSELIKKFADD